MNTFIRFGAVLLAAGVALGAVRAVAQEDPKPRTNKCLMVFAAHADDAEWLAGGTMLKYKEQGYEIVYVTTTNNTAGCILNRSLPSSVTVFTDEPVMHDYPADGLETMEIRTKETIDSATVFGAIPIFLNFWEPEIWPGAREVASVGDTFFGQYAPPGRNVISVASRFGDAVDAVAALMEKYRPEIVITHLTGAEKHDHGNTGYFVYLAFKEAMRKGAVGQLWVHPKGGWVEEPLWKDRLAPDLVLDVTPYVETWYKAWSKHVSQKGYGLYVVEPGKKYEHRYFVLLDAGKPSKSE